MAVALFQCQCLWKSNPFCICHHSLWLQVPSCAWYIFTCSWYNTTVWIKAIYVFPFNGHKLSITYVDVFNLMIVCMKGLLISKKWCYYINWGNYISYTQFIWSGFKLGFNPGLSLNPELNLHPIYLLWFQTKPGEFWFQLRFGNRWFRQFTIGFITKTSFNSGLKPNPALKPNLKPDQINWVPVRGGGISGRMDNWGIVNKQSV